MLCRQNRNLRSPDLLFDLSVAVACIVTSSCSDPDRDRLKQTTKATYDQSTGRLKELTYDANKNGRIDTWTDMDGTRPLRARIDRNEDGKLDRWESYDEKGQLAKVGFSRTDDGKPDAWAFAGRTARSCGSRSRRRKTRRRSTAGNATSRGAGPEGVGALLAADEDTDHDGKRDKWETYEGGRAEDGGLRRGSRRPARSPADVRRRDVDADRERA